MQCKTDLLQVSTPSVHVNYVRIFKRLVPFIPVFSVINSIPKSMFLTAFNKLSFCNCSLSTSRIKNR